MDTVFQYEIPVLHPLAVHFPLALILIGALAALLWSIKGNVFWRRCTLFLFATGMGGALFAYFTGEAMEEQSEGTPIVEELGGLHEDMALYTLLATGLTLAGMIALSFWLERRTTLERNPPDPLWARLIVSFLAFLAAALVAWTAHIGGTMVWGIAA